MATQNYQRRGAYHSIFTDTSSWLSDSGPTFNASLSSQLIFAFFSFQFWSRARLRASRSTKLVFPFHCCLHVSFHFLHIFTCTFRRVAARISPRTSRHTIKATNIPNENVIFVDFLWRLQIAIQNWTLCHGRFIVAAGLRSHCALISVRHEFNIRRKRKRWMDATCGLLNLIGPAAHCVNVTAATGQWISYFWEFNESIKCSNGDIIPTAFRFRSIWFHDELLVISWPLVCRDRQLN